MEAALHSINTDQPGKAYEISNRIIELFPNTKSAEQSKIQQGKIRNKSLNITVQQYILPGKPFIFRSEYANIDKFYCRLYKLNEEVEKKIKKRRYRDSYLDKSGIKLLIDMQPIQAWKQEFPKNEDYRPHSIWKKAPALNKGRYIMLMSNSPIFDMSGDNVIVHAEFTATPIMGLMQKEAGGNTLMHVLDAEKGNPLRATVQIMESTYDQDDNAYSDIISCNDVNIHFIGIERCIKWIEHRIFDCFEVDWKISVYVKNTCAMGNFSVTRSRSWNPISEPTRKTRDS